MDNLITLPESCGGAVLSEGLALRQSKAFSLLPDRFLSDGRRLLRGKVTDSFNFVDHPQVELDLSGSAVSGYRCDCPDYREKRSFCVHCAALIGQRGKLSGSFAKPVNGSAAQDVAAEIAPIQARGGVDLKDLSFRFCNSHQDLYPGEVYPQFPLERYIQIFGDIARAYDLYEDQDGWGGSCYGMCAASTMLYQEGSGIRPSDFRANARIPSELALSDYSRKLDMTLLEFIEATFLLQSTLSVNCAMARYLDDPNCIRTLAQRVKLFQQGKGAPVMMCIFKNARQEGGHAIVPFRLEPVSATEDKLWIYDPNCPMKTRYAYLTKDSRGQYRNWRFNMYDNEQYSGAAGGKMVLSLYDVYKKTWDSRGSGAVDNILSVRAGTTVLDECGTVLVRVTQDGVQSFREDIYQMPSIHGKGGSKFRLSLPAGAYTLRLEDSAEEELTARMIGQNLSLTLTTDAREASVCVDDSAMMVLAQVSEPGCHYSMKIRNTAAAMHEQTLLEGITDQCGLCLMQKDGRLYADGLTDRAALYINEEKVSLERIRQLSREEEGQQEQEAVSILNTLSIKKPEDPQS